MTEPDEPVAEATEALVSEPTTAPVSEPTTAPTEAPVSEPTAAPAATEAPAVPVVEPVPAETPAPAPTAAPAPAAPEVDPYEPPELALPNYDQTKATINGALAALDKKFDDGDLTTTEWNRARELERSKLDDLERARIKVELRNDERQRYWVYKWNIAQDTFFAGSADVYPAGSEARAEFIAMTQELGTQPRFAGMPHAKFLAEIDRRVRPLFSTTPAATAPVSAAPAAAVKGRVPDLAGVKQTLSNVPAADLNSTDGGEFAHIDKLTGEAYEKAIAGLSKAQRERWERS